jgi:hypothetical protein
MAMRLRFTLLLLVASTMTLTVAPLSLQQAPATPSPAVLFFDDFTTGQVDRSKWNVIVTGRTVNNEQQAYVDSPDTITAGVVARDPVAA